MPLYPYRCTQCGYRFEKIQRFSAKPEKECPKCGGVLERLLTAPGLNFKGSGWYVNDYASKSRGSGGRSAPPAAKPDTKSEVKTASGGESGAASPAASAAATGSPAK
ncbi:MAG: FmdB family zinc ribbon protein [Terracidiphilus sp.]